MDAIAPAAIVLVTFDAALLDTERSAVRRIARSTPVFLAGPGATQSFATDMRARRLDDNVVEAAHEVARVR